MSDPNFAIIYVVPPFNLPFLTAFQNLGARTHIKNPKHRTIKKSNIIGSVPKLATITLDYIKPSELVSGFFVLFTGFLKFLLLAAQQDSFLKRKNSQEDTYGRYLWKERTRKYTDLLKCNAVTTEVTNCKRTLVYL